MKIVSWNVNGIRAVMKKDFLGSLNTLDCDVLCLQETKAQDDQVQEALEELDGYHIYSNSATKKGYSGTAIISKEKPIKVTPDIGVVAHDDEGRVLTAEFDKFYLVTVYVPNSGSELKRLDYRQEWDKAFKDFVKELEKTKPVVVCGDLNVAHKDIDLARPKPNYNKSAGYMQEEIDGLDAYVNSGLVDSFRAIHPDKEGCYTWWSYRANARGNNVGWRIDYFLVSERFMSEVERAFICPDILGSDHCPVGVTLK